MAKEKQDFKVKGWYEECHTPKKFEKKTFKANPVMEATKQMSPKDFALENVVASNATHLLRPSQLDGNLDSTIENVGNLVDALDSIELEENNAE